jgi:hypothetical protein
MRRPMRGWLIACAVIFAPLSPAYAAESERPFATPSFVIFIDPTTIVDTAHGHRRFVQSEVRVAFVTHVKIEVDCHGKRFQLRGTKRYQINGKFVDGVAADPIWRADKWSSCYVPLDFVCDWPGSHDAQHKEDASDFWSLARRTAAQLRQPWAAI